MEQGRGRGAGGHGTRRRRAALPLLDFDCDNGSEFLNHHLLRYLGERQKPVAFTRARPYHKDDQAHVEQKNWMWPRQLLGYGRLEEESLVPQICALYEEVWGPLMNCFLPSLKLKEKWREKSAWKKRYEPARMAYARLMEAGVLNRKARRALREQCAELNPFALHDTLEAWLRPILAAAVEAPRRPAGGALPRMGGLTAKLHCKSNTEV